MSSSIPGTNENSQTVPNTTGNGASKPSKGGLEGIVAATTALSKVEGTAGRLIYHGYNIHDLATTTSFEEIAHLLWFGHLPNKAELADLKAKLAAERTLPTGVLKVISDLPTTAEPMDVLRTAASAWGASTIKGKPSIEQAIALTARFPVFLAAFHRLRNGQEPLESRSELDHAANYLYLLNGKQPEQQHVKALDAYLVLLADHGMNASTFTARVIASTGADVAAALSGAVGAMSGPLHGGAPARVLHMVEEVERIGDATRYVKGELDKGERLMGFGHRVYRAEDPRARVLRRTAKELGAPRYEVAAALEEAALAELHARRLPGDLFTPTFAVSRVSGWTAHILEQVGNNRLIRPEADYVGPIDEHFVPLDAR
ncbi:MAG: citrate synthase/methylcitrate synthase [Chloroflexi bacterium]|nr:MAG: citrate synthase/methylcitrate synthase [Chloroflexota bacterium]